MSGERRLRGRTPASRSFAERVQVVMELTSRLNVLPFSDIETRNALLGEILGKPLPDTVTVYPPFYCDYGLEIEFGERLFVDVFRSIWYYTVGEILVRAHTARRPAGAGRPPAQTASSAASTHPACHVWPRSATSGQRWPPATPTPRRSMPSSTDFSHKPHRQLPDFAGERGRSRRSRRSRSAVAATSGGTSSRPRTSSSSAQR
jgi:hypothetical protein